MSKLKDSILESAWELFREKGYEKVSLRAIAERAGTTIGNLTYHFPQKEDLLLAMEIFSQGEALRRFDSMPASDLDVLEELFSMPDQTEKILLDRAFYFNSIFKLAEDVPALRQNIEETRKIVYSLYMRRFERLKKAGYMRTDVPESVYANLIYAIILCISSWLYVREKFHDEASTVSIAALMRDLMYLCLTEEGRRLWEQYKRDNPNGKQEGSI